MAPNGVAKLVIRCLVDEGFTGPIVPKRVISAT